MKRKTIFIKFLFVIFCIFFSETSIAQSVVKHRSVTGVGGISKTNIIAGKSYFIQQSIGQSGVIGKFKTKNIVVIQGFIHPFFSYSELLNPSELNIEVITTPISNIYKISVADDIIGSMKVDLYNIMGQRVYSKKYEKTREFNVNLNSQASGCYILSIQANNRQFSTKLIKI